MLEILFTWMVMFFFIISSGLIIQSLFANDNNTSFLFTFISGFCFLVVYAQVYSIFLPIKSCLSLLILLIITIVVYLIFKKKINSYLKHYLVKNFGIFENKKYLICFLLFTFVILVTILLKTSQIPIDTDDYLYHCQAVRWCEEYGTVKGSGLINTRISFNSSLFPLFALFGFRDLFQETIHGVNGFVTFFSFIVLLVQLVQQKDKYSFVGFFLVIYYIRCLHSSISSLNTDIIPNIMVVCLAMLWLTERKAIEHANICMLLICTITMKLSFAPLGLLVLSPIYRFIKEKKNNNILFYIVVDFMIALPYLIRNYYISGWLLYPLSIIDIFDVEWKVPKEMVDDQALWVVAWALNPIYGYDLIVNGSTISEKLYVWLTWTATNYTKIVLLALIICSLIYIVVIIYKIVKKKKYDKHLFFLLIVLFIEFIYWAISAPDIRFTFTAIYLIPIFIISCIPIFSKILSYLINTKLLYIFTIATLILFVTKIDLNSCKISLIKQFPFNKCDTVEYKLTNTITLYGGGDDCLVGIDDFPGGEYLYIFDSIEALGESIEDGFKYKEQ